MDTYCWIHSTFSVSSKVDSSYEEVPHAGVAPPDGDVRYHKYYQWVCFTLFFQAILFYIPRFLWKNWEAGKCKMLVQDMNVPIVEPDTKKDRIELLVDYFAWNRNNHVFYSYKFYFCEFLNFINIFGQIFFMDFFLGGEFTSYGTDVIRMTEMEQEDRTDPMARVFPKVTKCTFHKFGPSGTVEKFDGLCVLPLNIINEKIYVFLWFWFILVSIATGFQLTQRLVYLMMPSYREYLLHARTRLSKPKLIQRISSKMPTGDWFLLYQLGKNIDPLIFKEFLEALDERLDERKEAEL